MKEIDVIGIFSKNPQFFSKRIPKQGFWTRHRTKKLKIRLEKIYIVQRENIVSLPLEMKSMNRKLKATLEKKTSNGR